MNTNWTPFDPKEIKIDVVKSWDIENRVAIELPAPIVNRVLATNSKLGEKSFGDDELQEMLLTFCVEHGIKQLDWTPIWPSVPVVDSAAPVLQKDCPFRFELDVDHYPEIEWPDFKSLEIIRPVRVISDDIVAAEMHEQCLVAGTSEKVESQFEVNDVIQIEVELHETTRQSLLETLKIEILVPESDSPLKFGNLQFDGFFSELKKSVVGDKIVLLTTATSKYSDKALSGQEIQATLRIVEAIRRTPLAIEDVLEQYGTPNEFMFKSQIRIAMEAAAERGQKAVITRQILSALLNKIKDQLRIPARVIQKFNDGMVMRERKNMEARGCTDEQVKAAFDSHGEAFDAIVLRHAQQQALVSLLSSHLVIAINEGDIMDWVANTASQQGRRPEEVRMELRNPEVFMQMTSLLMTGKSTMVLMEREMIVLTDMDADEWSKMEAEKSHQDDG